MNKENFKSYIALIGSMLIFGTLGVVRRYVPLSSAMLALCRGVLGSVFLLVFVLVRGGRLEINHVPVTSAHAAVYEGDVFTVRGMGRFKLEALGGKSRKDRLFIQYFQY